MQKLLQKISSPLSEEESNLNNVSTHNSGIPDKAYDEYIIEEELEKEILETLLYLKIEKDGRNLSVVERRVINMARAWLLHPEVLIIEEGALHSSKVGDNYFLSKFMEHFKEKTLLLIIKEFPTVRHFERIIYFKDATVKIDGSIKKVATDVATDFYQMVQEDKDRLKKVRASILFKDIAIRRKIKEIEQP